MWHKDKLSIRHGQALNFASSDWPSGMHLNLSQSSGMHINWNTFVKWVNLRMPHVPSFACAFNEIVCSVNMYLSSCFMDSIYRVILRRKKHFLRQQKIAANDWWYQLQFVCADCFHFNSNFLDDGKTPTDDERLFEQCHSTERKKSHTRSMSTDLCSALSFIIFIVSTILFI